MVATGRPAVVHRPLLVVDSSSSCHSDLDLVRCFQSACTVVGRDSERSGTPLHLPRFLLFCYEDGQIERLRPGGSWLLGYHRPRWDRVDEDQRVPHPLLTAGPLLHSHPPDIHSIHLVYRTQRARSGSRCRPRRLHSSEGATDQAPKTR